MTQPPVALHVPAEPLHGPPTLRGVLGGQVPGAPQIAASRQSVWGVQTVPAIDAKPHVPPVQIAAPWQTPAVGPGQPFAQLLQLLGSLLKLRQTLVQHVKPDWQFPVT